MNQNNIEQMLNETQYENIRLKAIINAYKYEINKLNREIEEKIKFLEESGKENNS